MEKHERRVGTVSRGIRCPIIREGDDLAQIVTQSVLEAAEYEGFELHDKDVIIIDDMISSGESLLDVAMQVKEKGAKRVFAFATFGLFTDGPDKFTQAYKDGIIDKVFTTNLVYVRPDVVNCDWYVGVNMCKYVSYIIDTLNHDASIEEYIKPVERIHKLVDAHKESQN